MTGLIFDGGTQVEAEGRGPIFNGGTQGEARRTGRKGRERRALERMCSGREEGSARTVNDSRSSGPR